MPQGYYSIQQWTPPSEAAPPEWITALRLPFGATLTAAEEALEKLDRPGFYRVIQMQRVIWAEKLESGLRLRKSHAASEEGLDRMRQMFERCDGRYPLEEVQEARRQAKKKADRKRARRTAVRKR